MSNRNPDIRELLNTQPKASGMPTEICALLKTTKALRPRDVSSVFYLKLVLLRARCRRNFLALFLSARWFARCLAHRRWLAHVQIAILFPGAS